MIDHLVNEIDVVMGMDVIDRLGSVSVGDVVLFGTVEASCTVSQECKQEQSSVRSCTAYTIEAKDFRVAFDGQQWTIQWGWKE